MRGLPSGTVTFLFTDVEGSTRLLQELGDGYAGLLAKQREILRRVFGEWDGREVDTQGDAFFYAFPAARKAIAAAAEAQRRLTDHDWPEGVELRIRIGLHTGESLDQSSEGYVGMDVHRAARLAHSGHGGQVLLSPTTAALVERDLPAGVSMEDLGEYRLKDLRAPIRISQLTVDGLPGEFPPLKAKPVRRHNLPAPISSFVGREQEQEQIARLLADSEVRLLTLTGPPGVGKTRLVLETARALNDEFPEGVIWVELVPVNSRSEIEISIAKGLGLDPETVSKNSLAEVAGFGLEGKPRLL